MIRIVKIHRLDEFSGEAIVTLADECSQITVFCWETPPGLESGCPVTALIYALNPIVSLASSDDRQIEKDETISVVAQYVEFGVFRMGNIGVHVDNFAVPGDVKLGAIALVCADRFDAIIEPQSGAKV